MRRLVLVLVTLGMIATGLACGVRGPPRPPRPEGPSVGGAADAAASAEIPSGGSELSPPPDAGLPGNPPAPPTLP